MDEVLDVGARAPAPGAARASAPRAGAAAHRARSGSRAERRERGGRAAPWLGRRPRAPALCRLRVTPLAPAGLRDASLRPRYRAFVNLRDLGEFALIARIERLRGARTGGAASCSASATTRRCCARAPARPVAVTTDAFVEGVHFRFAQRERRARSGGARSRRTSPTSRRWARGRSGFTVRARGAAAAARVRDRARSRARTLVEARAATARRSSAAT